MLNPMKERKEDVCKICDRGKKDRRKKKIERNDGRQGSKTI